MKAKVTKKGVIVPKEFFTGIEEVDILKEDGRIIIVPVFMNDPIFDLGKDPVTCNAPDASENHDKYLYTPNS